MPAKTRSNSEKIDQVYKEVKKHSKDIAGLKEDVAGLKQQFEVMNERQQRFEDKLEGFEKKQEIFEAKQIEFDEKLEDFKATMIKLYDEQERKAEEDREENRKFREAMYSLADRLVKDYENFTVEKFALGGKQDRLETEVEALQESDAKQNKALAKLETRVEYLEAKAS